MLGDYSAMSDVVMIMPEIKPEFVYGLFTVSGNEVEGPTYKRQTLTDTIRINEYPPGYRITWRPESPGEIWTFNTLVVLPYENAPEPIGAIEMGSIYVLYGSIKGSRSFRLVKFKDIKQNRVAIPVSN